MKETPATQHPSPQIPKRTARQTFKEICIAVLLVFTCVMPIYNLVNPRKVNTNRAHCDDVGGLRTDAARGQAAAGCPENTIVTHKDSPLAGPDFPAPSHLAQSRPLRAAIESFEAYLNNASSGFRTGEETAFAVSMFSAREQVTLYEHYYTPPGNVGVETVDRDSVFRIASVSKVFTVWAFLIGTGGDRYFNEPITKFIPELADANQKRKETSPITSPLDTLYDDIDSVIWEEVTVGQLASHAAGIARDITWDDLSSQPREVLDHLGLPEVDPSDIPTCGVNEETPNCSRKEFFNYLITQQPIFPAGHSPVYSNIAFQLLAYALESITGKDLPSILASEIFEPLGLSHSSYNTTLPGGVIPGGSPSLENGWASDSFPSMDHPGGSLYMSTADLVRAGQAILQSTLVPRSVTRRWLKPVLRTGDVASSVGAPWEIRSLRSCNNRILEYYNKQGDVGAYHTALVLSPQYEVGWVVQVAGIGENASAIRTRLMNAFHTHLMPAVTEQAKIEAGSSFDGQYVDEASNSSVRVVAGYEGHLGLAVLNLTVHGKTFDILGAQGMPEKYRADTTLLFPSTLQTIRQKTGAVGHGGSTGSGQYVSRLGFRAVFFSLLDERVLIDPSMISWATLGSIKHGQRYMDDWVFELNEDGVATALNIRALRLKLRKV